jgi:tetratricopeptide (TPR) repeat protein
MRMPIFRPRRPSFLLRTFVAFLVPLLSCAAWADLVHLKNGRVLNGEVIEDDGKTIVVRVPNGTIRLRCEQIESIERQSPLEYRLGLAREQMSRQRFDMARESLDQARAAAPDKLEAREALAAAYGEYAHHLKQFRRLAEAQAAYRKLIELQPDSPTARDALGALALDSGELDGLLTQARAAATRQDFDGALAKYEAATRFSPDALDRAAPEMAICYARRAEASYRRKGFEEAAADLERAFALDSSLASRLENFYAASALPPLLARASGGDLESARRGLTRVLSVAPANRAVLYVAGCIELDLKNPSGAVALYARALKSSPGAATAEHATELRGELERALGVQGTGLRFNLQPVDEAAYAKSDAGEFQKLEEGCFVIYHHNEALAEDVARNLDAQLARIQDLTGLRVDWRNEKVKVFIHRTQQEYVAATGQEAWSGGMSRFARMVGRGLVKMEIHSWQTSPRLLKSVIPHELTHLVVNSNLNAYEDLPRALHEGFAVLLEPEFRHAYYMNFLRVRLKSESFIPLSELLAMKSYPGDQEFFYSEGYALIAYLSERSGLEKTIKVLLKSPGVPIETRLLNLTGARGLEQLESDWKDWVGKAK